MARVVGDPERIKMVRSTKSWGQRIGKFLPNVPRCHWLTFHSTINLVPLDVESLLFVLCSLVVLFHILIVLFFGISE